MRDVESLQSGILAPLPKQARYLLFSAWPKASFGPALRFLRDTVDGESAVIGVGPSLAQELGGAIPALETFVAPAGSKRDIPSTPSSLWIWLRGEDRGELWHRARAVERGLGGAFVLTESTDAFLHREGRDLIGYEDGTENPVGDKALSAAFVSGAGPGLDGSSFVVVQRWLHDLDRFEAMNPSERDHAIGRRIEDNTEITDAPPSSHVSRTAQERFSPEAFVWRRSMPRSDGRDGGLVFVAFGRSFYAFEVQLRRMSGAEDGIADALFAFTRPVSTAYFWCPPMHEGRIDLRALSG